MKLYKGRKRIAMKLARECAGILRWRTTEYELKLLDYLSKARPGDIIGACTGFNHRIKTVDYLWESTKNGKTQTVRDIRVVDDTDHWHWFSGAG